MVEDSYACADLVTCDTAPVNASCGLITAVEGKDLVFDCKEIGYFDIKGDAAKTVLTDFDFTEVWTCVDNDTPTLKSAVTLLENSTIPTEVEETDAPVTSSAPESESEPVTSKETETEAVTSKETENDTGNVTTQSGDETVNVTTQIGDDNHVEKNSDQTLIIIAVVAAVIAVVAVITAVVVVVTVTKKYKK